MHARMSGEAESKDGLKRRFQQNQNDVAFTIVALLPTLGKGLNTVLDVDSVTQQLKQVGEGSKAAAVAAEQQEATAPSANGHSAAKASSDLLTTTTQTAGVDGETQAGPPSPEVPQGQPVSALDAMSEPRPPPISANAMLTPAPKNGALSEGEAMKEGSETAEQLGGNSEDTSSTPAQPQEQSLKGSANGSAEAEAEAEARRKAQEAEAEAEARKRAEEEAEAARTKLQQEEDEQRRLQEQAAERERKRQEQLALDRKRKMQLWDELKIVSITRALTTVYAINLLSHLTHVQLNLLGRYAYLASLSSDAKQPAKAADDPFEDAWSQANGEPAKAAASTSTSASSSSSADRLSSETEERYLTFSWYFLHHGAKQLSERVRGKVEEVMSSIPLKTQLTHAETMAVLSRIKRKIEYEYEMNSAGEEVGTGDSAQNFPGFVGGSGGATLPNEGAAGSSKMALGAESLLPSGFSGFEDESTMSVSAASFSTRGVDRGRRRRVNLLQYLLPSDAQGDAALLRSAGLLPEDTASEPLDRIDPHLSALLDETRDILESKDAHRVLRKCVHATFDVLIESMRQPFGLASRTTTDDTEGGAEGQDSSRIHELRSREEEEEIRRSSREGQEGRRLKLAAVLPLLARQSNAALESVPNEFVDAIGGVKDLRAWSAIIYSSWTT